MIEFLEIFFFGRGDVQMAMDPIIGGALISGGIQILGGLFGGGQAKRRERAAKAESMPLTDDKRSIATLLGETGRQQWMRTPVLGFLFDRLPMMTGHEHGAAGNADGTAE